MSSVVDKILYNSKEKLGQVCHFRASHESVSFNDINTVAVGSLKIAVLHSNKFGKDEKMFHCWIHSDFMTQTLTSPSMLEPSSSGSWKLKLTKSELDKACKDKNDKFFSKNFSVTITLEELDEQKADASILDQYESLRRLIRLNSEVSRLSRAKAASEAVAQQPPSLAAVGETLRRKLSLRPVISRSDDETQWRSGRFRSSQCSPQSRSQDSPSSSSTNEDAKTPPIPITTDLTPEPKSPQTKSLEEHKVKIDFGQVSNVSQTPPQAAESEDEDDEDDEDEEDEPDLSTLLDRLKAIVEEQHRLTQQEIDIFAERLVHNKERLDALLTTLSQS